MDSDENCNSSSSDSESERERTNNYYIVEEDYWIKNQPSEDEITYANYIFNLEIELSKLISNKNYSNHREYSYAYNNFRKKKDLFN